MNDVPIWIIGQPVTSRGLTQQVDRAGDPIPYTTRAASYLRHQPPVVPLHFDHTSWQLGDVRRLERSEVDGLMAFARCDVDIADMLDDGPWWFSDRIAFESTGPMGMIKVGMTLSELSLTREPASLGTRPVCWSRSTGEPFGLPMSLRGLWRRGFEQESRLRYRRAPDHLVIHDLDELDLVDEWTSDPDAARKRLDAMMTSVPRKATATHRARPSADPYEDRVYAHSYPAAGLHLTAP